MRNGRTASNTNSNRQNQTDTVSFHRDVPNMQEDTGEHGGENDEEDERQEFSFEEPAIDGGHEQSIEEEEKSLINALSFKKQGQTNQADKMSVNRQSAWATTAKN